MIRTTFATMWNRLTGQGGDGDHALGANVSIRPGLAHGQIAELLNRAPMIRIACESMGEDIVRAWRTLPVDGIKWLEAEETLGYRDTIERAAFYAEAFGGAFVIPRFSQTFTGANALAAPFRQPKIGTLLGFRVLPPHMLDRSTSRQPNPAQGAYDLPTWFAFKVRDGANVEVHHSWTFAVHGAMRIEGDLNAASHQSFHNALGQSKVDLIWDDFSRAAAGMQGLSHLLVKANIDVLKIVGLSEQIRRCNTEDEMQKALTGLIQTTSVTVKGANVFQPIIVDADEEFERKGVQATGAAEMATKLLDVFIAATRIPRTRLMGEQSKGLANGGEADITNYYDRCGAIRERRVMPLLNWMDGLTAADRGLEPINWEFNPLWQLSAKERSELEAKDADTDLKYAGLDIPYIASKITRRLAERGTYGFTEQELVAIEQSDGVIDVVNG